MVVLEAQDLFVTVLKKLGLYLEYYLHSLLLNLEKHAEIRLKLHPHSLIYTIYQKYMPHGRSHNFCIYENSFSMFCTDHLKTSRLDFTMLELW